VGHLADQVGRDARLALGVLEGVRLDLALVGLEPGRRPADELLVLEPGGDDLASDGIGQGDVAADVDAQPAVRPLRRTRATRIDRVQPGAIVDPAQEVVEEDRMRLPGVRTPQDDEVRLLRLTI
jgi:hypothetical protein